jgi:hypothetical protein
VRARQRWFVGLEHPTLFTLVRKSSIVVIIHDDDVTRRCVAMVAVASLLYSRHQFMEDNTFEFILRRTNQFLTRRGTDRRKLKLNFSFFFLKSIDLCALLS